MPVFSIELTECNLHLLLKIKEFLILNLGFDKYSTYKLRCSSVISINKQKARLGKPSVTFVIQNINILNNYFIPYLEDMKFISKKGLDFLDFKTICKAIYCGSHKREEIKALILKLSYTMNNFRLSTNPGESSIIYLIKSEIDKINNAKPTLEHLSDGRVRDIATKKIVSSNASCVYEISKPNGEVLIVETLDEVLKIVGVGFRTLKSRLDVEVLEGQEGFSSLAPEFNGHIIKRIPVFYPNKR